MIKKITLAIISLLLTASSVSAQVSPADWQQNATGLDALTRSDKRTAGLGFIIDFTSWPKLFARGGARNIGWSKADTPVTIDLGEIRLPGTTTPSTTTISTDWSHSTYQVLASGQSFTLTASRLSPAVLIDTQATSLQIGTGDVHFDHNGSQLTNGPDAPSFPKYVNFGTTQTLSATPTINSSPDNWLLIWYGANSHFADTRIPKSYTDENVPALTLNLSDTFQADIPLLLTFETKPTSIKHAAAGGVELQFPSAAGKLTIMPLLGEFKTVAATTDTWTSLPSTISQQINFWYPRSCQYPQKADESYQYDASQDKASITQTTTFQTICTHHNTKFNPLPPLVASAITPLSITTPTLTDANYPTPYGPLLGLDANTLTWSLSGLDTYISSTVNHGAGTIPSHINQAITNQIQALTAAGHLRPWHVLDKINIAAQVGNTYFTTPSQVVNVLGEVASSLSGQSQTDLIDYIEQELISYPIESTAQYPVSQGAFRQGYDPTDQTTVTHYHERRAYEEFDQPGLYGLYALALYYQLSAKPLPATIESTLTTLLNQTQQETDWATGMWLEGFEEPRPAVVNLNRYLTGLIGALHLTNNATTHDTARALFARAAAARIGATTLPAYQYQTGEVVLPSDPDWQVKQTSVGWIGYIYNYGWTNPADDIRQALTINQFRTYLYDTGGPDQGLSKTKAPVQFSQLTPLWNAASPIIRLIGTAAPQQTSRYFDTFMSISPQWYVAFSEGILGSEHGVSYPMDSYTTFLYQAYINNAPGSDLESYTDIPWTDVGDFFYLHKLALTAQAYQGWSWDNDPIPTPPPDNSTDLDGDLDTDEVDKRILLDNYDWTGTFGGILSDIIPDGIVNAFDLNRLLQRL